MFCATKIVQAGTQKQHEETKLNAVSGFYVLHRADARALVAFIKSNIAMIALLLCMICEHDTTSLSPFIGCCECFVSGRSISEFYLDVELQVPKDSAVPEFFFISGNSMSHSTRPTFDHDRHHKINLDLNWIFRSPRACIDEVIPNLLCGSCVKLQRNRKQHQSGHIFPFQNLKNRVWSMQICTNTLKKTMMHLCW